MRGHDVYASVEVKPDVHADRSGIVDNDEHYQSLDPSHRPTDEEAERMADQDNQDDIDNDPDLSDSPFTSDDVRVEVAENLHNALLDTGDDVPSGDLAEQVHVDMHYTPLGFHEPEDYQEYWDDHYGDDDDDDDGTSNDSENDDQDDPSDGGRRDPSGFIDYSHPDTYKGTKDFLGAFGWDGNDV